MNPLHEFPISQLNESPCRLIGSEWMLVTAQKPDGTVNTMTASWGGLGYLWNKNVAFVFIRPERYTKEFVDAADTLSLTFWDAAYKEKLSYLGTVSGRDEPKIEKAGLTVVRDGQTPYFAQAKTVLLCQKLYRQPMQGSCFFDQQLAQKWYADGSCHDFYVVEILKALTR